MGNRGKVIEQARARELRAAGWTYGDIVAELGVSKASVSLWCREVEPDRQAWEARARANRNRGARPRRPHPQQTARLAEIDRLKDEGRQRIGRLSEREFLVAGAALYAGEGAKADGLVKLVNSDPRIIQFFLAWLRHQFAIDEQRLRFSLYLHRGLDLDRAIEFWTGVTGIPVAQWHKPYRAVPDTSIRTAKHPMGCGGVIYSCSRTHRAVMGLVGALLTCDGAVPG